jgi:GMP synthase (glutamine-hydrolysing)
VWSNKNSILILDFGSQYTQLIARRVREHKVYSEIHPYTLPLERIRALEPAGIILSGGPSSVYDAEAPLVSPELFSVGVPILGICYGVQLASHLLGGKVTASQHREYGRAQVRLEQPSELFAGFTPGEEISVWMSHGDRVEALPPGFRGIGTNPSSPAAAVEAAQPRFFGVQFHPEVVHTPRGGEILSNFLFRICQCHPTWTMAGFVEEAVASIRRAVGNGRAICGLSGGVDSSVAAALVHRAIGDRLTCIFVDNGLLRAGERGQVESLFQGAFKMDLHVVDAAARFLADLAGQTDPEVKRKRMRGGSGAPTSSCRGPSIPTSSSRSRTKGPRSPSSRTTTWAACPTRCSSS